MTIITLDGLSYCGTAKSVGGRTLKRRTGRMRKEPTGGIWLKKPASDVGGARLSRRQRHQREGKKKRRAIAKAQNTQA